MTADLPDPWLHLDIPPGLYRATDDRLIRVLYARGGLVHHWAIDDPATSADSAGKVLARMRVSDFRDGGFTFEEQF